MLSPLNWPHTTNTDMKSAEKSGILDYIKCMSKQLNFLLKPKFLEQLMKKVTWKIYISSHFFQMLNHLPKETLFLCERKPPVELMVKTAGSEFSKWRGKVIFNWDFLSHFRGCISPVREKKKKGTSEKLKSFTSPLINTLGKSNMQIWYVSRKSPDSLLPGQHCSQANDTLTHSITKSPFPSGIFALNTDLSLEKPWIKRL